MSNAAFGSSRVLVRQCGGRSRVVSIEAVAPAKLMHLAHRPDADEDRVIVHWLQHGGGVLYNDRLSLDVSVDTGATLALTSPSMTRAYRSRSPLISDNLTLSDSQSQSVVARVGDGALLCYLPSPCSIHRHSAFQSSVTVHLSSTGSVVLYDCVTAGRLTHGESFSMHYYASSLLVYRDNTLVVRDFITMRPDDSVLALVPQYRVYATLAVMGPRMIRHALTLYFTINHSLITANRFRNAAVSDTVSKAVMSASWLGSDTPSLPSLNQPLSDSIATIVSNHSGDGEFVGSGCLVRVACVDVEQLNAVMRALTQPFSDTFGEAAPWIR